MTSAPAARYAFEFYPVGSLAPTSAAPFDAAAYVVAVNVEDHKPPLLPRLPPDQYRAQWARACAMAVVREAYRRQRERLQIPKGCAVKPFVAVRAFGAKLRLAAGTPIRLRSPADRESVVHF